jgi:hypothetical protein
MGWGGSGPGGPIFLMRRTGAILVLTQVFWLAGCIVGAKPRTARNIPPPPQQQQRAPAPTPAAAPGPLSSPQTNAELLPPPQPLDQEAVAAAQPPDQPPPAPAPAPQRNTANRRRPAGPPQISSKPESDTTAQTPAPAPAAPVDNGSRIQEILPPSEQKRLQDEADGRKREVRQVLAQVLAQARGRRLTGAKADLKNTIESYLKLSDNVEKLGDMRQADDLAQRAWILAKDLQSGR